MKKKITLAVVLFVIILSFMATIVHSNTIQSTDIQENTILINGFSYDNIPLQDNDKFKLAWIIFIAVSTFIALKSLIRKNSTWQFTHRLLLFTPIFYQSNFVIRAL
ncbi:hypothetical protein ACLM5H_00365 [Fredinandcohnia humi]